MTDDIFGSDQTTKKDKDVTQSGNEEKARKRMIDEGKAAAVLAYIPFMCFVPLIKMKENPFAVKHGKQGLILFVIEIIAVIFLLPKISDLLWSAVVVLCLAAAVAGVFFAVQGEEWKVPFIGDWADKLKI
jgi:fumarate reductase subunit D